MKLYFEAQVSENYQKIRDGFTRDLFLFLKPPGVSLKLLRFDGCSPGDEVHLELKGPAGKQNWISLITSEEFTGEEWSFVDEGKSLPWPLATWKHHHRVKKVGEKSSTIVDDITFTCAHRLLEAVLYPVLWATFSVRPARYKKFFQGS